MRGGRPAARKGVKMEKFDVAILGGGPAGYTAALYCARSGYSTAVIEKMTAGGQVSETDRVENYPGFDGGIEGLELGERMRRGAERFGAKTRYGEIKSAELSGGIKRIVTDSGEIFARAAILGDRRPAENVGDKRRKRTYRARSRVLRGLRRNAL